MTVVKFYIPGLTTEETLILYPYLKEKAELIALSVMDCHIYNVRFWRFGKPYLMQVGRVDPFVYREVVFCIFWSSVCYIAFGLTRGILQGEPFLISTTEVISVEQFEAE